jgi:transposase-like protein
MEKPSENRVLAVAGDREPYFSAATRRRIGSECDRPGATVCGVAEAHGLPFTLVYDWREAWRRSQSLGAERSRPLAFTPVEIVAEAASDPVAVRMTGRGVTIELGAMPSVELAEALAEVLAR